VTFNYDIQVFYQQQLCRGQKDKFNHILFDTVGFLESEESQLKKKSKYAQKPVKKLSKKYFSYIFGILEKF
jgi:hypothetical protein